MQSQNKQKKKRGKVGLVQPASQLPWSSVDLFLFPLQISLVRGSLELKEEHVTLELWRSLIKSLGVTERQIQDCRFFLELIGIFENIYQCNKLK